MSVICWITSEEEAPSAARWSYRFAESAKCELVLIFAEFTRSPTVALSFLSEDALPEEEKVLVSAQSAIENLREAGKFENSPTVSLIHLRANDIVKELKIEIGKRNAELLVLPKNSKSEKLPRRSQAIQELFREAPCQTIIMRFGSSTGEHCNSILVPVSGGPNAAAALKTGYKLVETHQSGSFVPFRVAPHGNAILQSVGQKELDEIQEKVGLSAEGIVNPKLCLSNNIEKAIIEEAEQGYDLILLGDSGVGSVRKRILGTIPAHLLSNDHKYAVGVVRAAKPFHNRLKSKVEDWLDLTVPQLERNDRIALVEHLSEGSRWSFDFLALMGLSTAIAGLGLLQNSSSVVIGAMLVAPLMVPLLGAGLALVQENRGLILTSSRSIVYGFLIALAISIVLGAIVPGASLTEQIEARGGPTLLDMGVALLSGMAAAYCVARPNLSAALPGVAIAAALVPPIGSIGISIAIGATDTAFGASLLFVTNVICIILGAVVSFYAGGIRGAEGHSSYQTWAHRTTLSLVLGAAILSVPLGSMLFSKITHITPVKENTLPLGVRNNLEALLLEKGVTLLRVDPSSKFIHIEIASPTAPTPELVDTVSKFISENYAKNTTLKLKTSLVTTKRVDSIVPKTNVPTKQTENRR